MATILDKELTRESTVKYNDREIQVTLTADQKISFKLKGMKSGALTIGIEALYNQLFHGSPVTTTSLVKNVDDDTSKKGVGEKSTLDNPMISLYELRTKINTTPIGYENMALLDGFIAQCIKGVKKPFLDKAAAIQEQEEIVKKSKLKK